jgi:hypothetical protein
MISPLPGPALLEIFVCHNLFTCPTSAENCHERRVERESDGKSRHKKQPTLMPEASMSKSLFLVTLNYMNGPARERQVELQSFVTHGCRHAITGLLRKIQRA